MAPEQAAGEALTGAADQYALASTLYEALAGAPPFATLNSDPAAPRGPRHGERDAGTGN
jgi:serine/threonine protein kinase